MNAEQFIEILIDIEPRLEDTRAHHLIANERGLPHVLMGEISNWYVRQYRMDPKFKIGRPVTNLVEEALNEGDGGAELVVLSLFENIATESDVTARFLSELGHNSKIKFQSMI